MTIGIMEVFPWLNQCEDSHLSLAIRIYSEQLENHLKASHAEEAWKIIADLEKSSRTLHDEAEVAEALVICGYAAYRLGNHEEAIRLLEKALARYCNRPHQSAVVQWMIGSIQWGLPERRNAAINSWQASLNSFTNLSKHLSRMCIPGGNFGSCSREQRQEWYDNQIRKMELSLRQALSGTNVVPSTPTRNTSSTVTKASTTEEKESPPSTPPSSPLVSQHPPPHSPSQTTPAQPYPPIARESLDYIQYFVVREEISAGKFKSTGGGDTIGHIHIEQVLIDDQPYVIKGLRGGKRIVLAPDYKYTVIKVKGDSMNQAGIESGDFVLLRVQDTASHNQIVAAEIYGVDDYATLKKYKIKGNQIVLEPVSDNPENKEFKFNMDHKNEQGFVIHGIAVAVFKPLGPANRSDSG